MINKKKKNGAASQRCSSLAASSRNVGMVHFLVQQLDQITGLRRKVAALVAKHYLYKYIDYFYFLVFALKPHVCSIQSQLPVISK